MSDSENHIEKMHQQLQKMAEREQMLINALDEALGRADRKLLDDVRSVTANHEARRAIIMSELQTLAHRIGALPVAEVPIDTIAYEPPEPVEAPSVNDLPSAEPVARGGDWRRAAKNITDGLDFHLAGAGQVNSHSS